MIFGAKYASLLLYISLLFSLYISHPFVSFSFLALVIYSSHLPINTPTPSPHSSASTYHSITRYALSLPSSFLFKFTFLTPISLKKATTLIHCLSTPPSPPQMLLDPFSSFRTFCFAISIQWQHADKTIIL